MSANAATGTFTSQTTGSSIGVWGGGNAAIWGTFSATLQLECSYDKGLTWLPVSRDTAGNAAAYTAPVNISFEEPEHDVLFRWNCTAYTSGTVNYRISGNQS